MKLNATTAFKSCLPLTNKQGYAELSKGSSVDTSESVSGLATSILGERSGKRFALTISGVARKNGRDCSVCCAPRSRRSRRNQSKWLDKSSSEIRANELKRIVGNERGDNSLIIETGICNKVVIFLIQLSFYAHRFYLSYELPIIYSTRKFSSFETKKIERSFSILFRTEFKSFEEKFFSSLVKRWKTCYCAFSLGSKKRDRANFNRVEKEERESMKQR